MALAAITLTLYDLRLLEASFMLPADAGTLANATITTLA